MLEVWQYGLDLRPGLKVAPPTLLYGRVGVSAAEIKAHSNAQNNGNFFGSWSVPVKASDSSWKAAFRLGLGIEHAFCSRLHLRTDYIFTNLGVVSFKNTATGQDSMSRRVTVTDKLSSHVQNHAIIAGISYYFYR